MQQLGLIDNSNGESIYLKNADLQLFTSIFSAQDCEQLFKELRDQVDWTTESIRIAGIERVVPRLTAWYGDENSHYRYSKIDHKPSPWLPILLDLKVKVESLTGCTFNSALCNLYRSGQDSVAWHSDDETELGQEPSIASLSFGTTRTFQLKHKTDKKLRHKISLTSGSLLLMNGATQHHWSHQVPKEPLIKEPRINITFRHINS